MLRYRLILFLLYTFGPVSLWSQDIHYSQFFNSPLNLSPSLTGSFNGDSRYHANYRNQWASVPVDYVSADVGADFKIRNFKNENYLAVGGLINYDMAGDLNLSLTGINLLMAYSFKLNETGTINPAINISYAQRKFEAGNVLTGNQWDGRAYNPSIPAENIGSDNSSYFDLGAGINYRWQKAYRSYFDLGVGAYHIIKPTDSFNPDATYTSERPMRLSFYAMVNLPITNGMDILLNGLYAKQEAYSEKVINSQLKFYLGQRQSAAFYLGAGYRFDDAWYPMVAIELGSVYGAFSYDFNISDFDVVTMGRGGPEISLRYIIARIPKGVDKPCPLY